MKVTPIKWTKVMGCISSDLPQIVFPITDQDSKAIVSAVNFFKNTDFESLKKQKLILLNMIMAWGEADDPQQRKDAEEAEGVVEMIEAIQDIAVDSFGAEESEVFNLTKDIRHFDGYHEMRGEDDVCIFDTSQFSDEVADMIAGIFNSHHDIMEVDMYLLNEEEVSQEQREEVMEALYKYVTQ